MYRYARSVPATLAHVRTFAGVPADGGWQAVPMSSSTGRPAAVVTGANRGIGREVARQLSEQGFTVVLTARDPDAAARAARDIGPGILPCRLDVTDPASITAAAGLVERELGRADVLVNNAAIDYDTDQHAARADLDRVATDLDTNVPGPRP
jgi:NAD(P)-dependent dehydrogenase (short-subunit alcohol dehydrogenase family)